jgi:putative inorganic carbon (HCO3(-)) transporter
VRDLLIVGIVLIGSLYALRQPWVGVMLWTWISIMSPHSMAYGFSQTFPVAAIAAVATLIGLLITKDRRNPIYSPATVWLVCFMVWICITYAFSYNVAGSSDMLLKVLKIDFMILITLVLLSTRKHINIFVWVVVLSLGFFGVKGGIFTIATGGSFRVWGPGGFIGGNNEVALALIVVIPLMRYLQLQVQTIWVKHGLTAAMLLSAAAALGSQSRGALLALAAMSIYLWLKSPKKILFGGAMVLFGMALLAFMPEQWESRMNTIQTYEQDASAMGRINAWWAAYNVATSRITGAGFDMYTPEIFAIYAPNPQDLHAAHSIYFQVLGEHGFIGLFLFLGIWWYVWRTAAWLIRNAGKEPEARWCQHLGAMCQVSLVGYAVGGAFLSLAYFDLPYDILVLVVLARRWFEEKSWMTELQDTDPVPTLTGAGKP